MQIQKSGVFFTFRVAKVPCWPARMWGRLSNANDVVNLDAFTAMWTSATKSRENWGRSSEHTNMFMGAWSLLIFVSSLVPYSCSWKCTENALLNGLITVWVKQIQERTCVAIVAKLVLKLIWTRRSYAKTSSLCVINVKHREEKSWRGDQYKLPKQTNRGLAVLKTIDRFIFKILQNKSIC